MNSSNPLAQQPPPAVMHSPQPAAPLPPTNPTPQQQPSQSRTTMASILDRPLPVTQRSYREVSLSTFAFIFAELIAYSQQRADRVSDIEKRLAEFGHSIGTRYIDISFIRASQSLHPSTTHRPRTILALLQHIHNVMWKQLFGHSGDGLEKSTDSDDEYYIFDNQPITNKFLSVPKDMGELNCAAFIAGIIEGVSSGSGFECECSAHFNAANGVNRTVYIIKFETQVMKREAALTHS